MVVMARNMLLFFLLLFLLAGCGPLVREHKEAAAVPIQDIDFGSLKSGVWAGEYDGGMYKWRANSVEVHVQDGRVTEIRLLMAKESNDHALVHDQIIQGQTLKVDGISGASLTSRAYIKAVEQALIQALSVNGEG